MRKSRFTEAHFPLEPDPATVRLLEHELDLARPDPLEVRDTSKTIDSRTNQRPVA